jgi:hypothetical protein
VYQHGSGHGSWFYRQAGTPDQTIEHAATYLTEYRWAVATWVEGPDDGGDTTPPDPEQPDDGGVGEPEGPTQPGPAQPEKDVTPDVTEPAVPIKIDAGL